MLKRLLRQCDISFLIFFPYRNFSSLLQFLYSPFWPPFFFHWESPLSSRVYLLTRSQINWITLQTCSSSSTWQKNYDKAKAIWIPCYCTPNYFASREEYKGCTNTDLFFFLQMILQDIAMILLRSFVQCSTPVFGDKIHKYNDGQMNFKSSFKALMEHFSLKRPCVQAMLRV